MLYSNHIYIFLLWFWVKNIKSAKRLFILPEGPLDLFLLRRNAPTNPSFKDCNILKFHDKITFENSILKYNSIKKGTFPTI